MKKIFTILFSLCVFGASAQTTIYTQTFNSSYSDWSLNTTDLGGDASGMDNQWVVNNVYTGYTSPICFTTIPNTANEPAGITGFPNSNYLHIYSLQGVALCFGTANCNFDAGTGTTNFVALNTPVVTTGYTGVSFSFWWLCQGDATSCGKLYYRTSSGGAWTILPGGPATYFGSSSWTHQTITNPVLDGQPFLEFGFQFNNGSTGSDPAFAVDEITVTGTSASTVPTPSFAMSLSTLCQDSCTTLTNTSTGGVDSFLWSCPGATIANPRVSPASMCFSVSGTSTVTLTDYHAGTPYTTTHSVAVTPPPHPPLTRAGFVLTVPTGYISYQWLNGTTPITGATTNTYTFSAIGIYTVVVDSAGCYGFATFNYAPLVVSNVPYNLENSFRVSQTGTDQLKLFAAHSPDNNLYIHICDIRGREVFNGIWVPGSAEQQINDFTVPAGIYIIKLSNANESYVFRCVKN